MTQTVAEPAVEEPAPPAARRLPRILLSLLPWLIPAVAAGGVLHVTHTPDRAIAVYAVYLLLVVVLPGTLVFRAVFGSRGNWPEDLGLGAATGLVVLLAGWALAAATGLQQLLPGWPVLVVLPFLLVPALRRHWRAGPGEPLPLGWSWAMAGVLMLTVAWAAAAMHAVPRFPATVEVYPDLYYHLALVHEMTRSMPFQVPQLAEDTLRYHYLSDADIASASMITGISADLVLLRLWLMPIVAIGVAVFAVLGRSVSGRWWAGPLAALLGFVGQTVVAGVPFGAPGIGLPISLLSPSQTYAMPLIGLFVVVAVDALRGRSLRWAAWAALPLLAVACAGAKASVLPPVAAGLLLVVAVTLVFRRRIPWTALGLLASVGFGMVVGLRLFAGGGAGTLQVQFLASLRWFSPYTDLLGNEDGPEKGGLWPHGLAHADAAGRWFVAWVILWWLIVQAPRLIGLVLTPRSSERESDPVPWLIGGIVVAGTLAMWALWHPSASQIYFMNGVFPFCGVLTAWALADRVRSWWVPFAGAAAGAAWELLAPEVKVPAEKTFGAYAWAMAVPLLRTAALVAVAVLIAVLIWRRRALRAVPAALLAAVIGAGVMSPVSVTVERLADPAKPQARAHMSVRAIEMRAAFWLEENTGRDDVVATNVHCMPMSSKVCNARAFWVAGLGGRRTLVESWGYSDKTVAAHGVNGKPYIYQPAPDPAIFELNQRAFEQGDPADVARLRDEYGVRWLFADSRAGAVSPRLAESAQVAHQQGPVTIYRLR
ncbi:hypothetical protein AB0M02_42750 [Actinoplanes sp. NPDC051861]|uniref:hypothetical protein n=1 Tax=Actinoplanes sp. NPDC051861 TaxID=3155170 RepID=UPI003424C66E